MVMEFSFINVNLNIDRKLFFFMCAGLTLTVILSDESNPVANVLRSIPPISIVDRYAIPLIKTALGYFRGYTSMSGTIGAKVPINADSFVSTAETRGNERNRKYDGAVDRGDASHGNTALKSEKMIMDEKDALSFSTKSKEGVDEESMPKSQAEMTKETAEDTRESAKYVDGEQTFRKGKRKFKVKK